MNYTKKTKSNIKSYIDLKTSKKPEKQKIVYKSLKKNLFRSYGIIFSIWGIYFFTYFGFQFSLFSLSDILWLNYTLLGLVELLGLILSTYITKKIKRLLVIKIALFVASICCLMTNLTKKSDFMTLSLVLSKLICF